MNFTRALSPRAVSLFFFFVFFVGGEFHYLQSVAFFSVAEAQVVAPDPKNIFREDSDEEKQRMEQRRQGVMKTSPLQSDELDFSAPQVQFDQEKNVVSGEGGVLISGRGLRLQGERGSIQLDTNDVELSEDVLLTSDTTSFEASRIKFNLESEVGEFEDLAFTLEEGAYGFKAKRAEKLNDVDLELFDCFLSTCSCPDGETPWSLTGSRAFAEREGYAHVYDSLFRFQGVPIFYTPWIAFPIKQERSSGLLVPEFGFSNQNGTYVKLPFYAVIDGSSDMTVAPFTETKTRRGVQFDYRESFSPTSNLESRFIYSDETPRDGSLRGTDVTNIAEPSIDDNRLGVYAKQNWSNSSASDVPLSMVSDIHWVSDTLFLREIENSNIGLASSRYATSRVAFRSQLGEFGSSSLVGEWNEALISPQDETFQRLPELSVTGGRSFRPFGFNPYGLKVTPKLDFRAVEFYREEGYDGLRYDISPSLKIPFHYKNYFNSDAQLAFHHTTYNLDDVSNPSGGEDLDSSQDRQLVRFSYEVRTALERVFDVEKGGMLSTLTSLGSRNQTHELNRVKHTLEPRVNFSYVPNEEQDALPLFDSFDRVRQRSLITYELMSRLIGSFDYLQGGTADIEEFVSDVDDFERLDTLSPLTDFDAGMGLPGGAFGVPLAVPTRAGRQQRELTSFRILQSYDYVEDKKNLDETRSAFSDVGTQLYFNPTQDFGFGVGANYDAPDQDLSSWQVASHLFDDRGDSIRARYSYVENVISQVEGNLELVVGPQWKVGYYARFDDQESEFIEHQGALRFSSACDCWHIDVGYSELINPDRERVLLRFTLSGLGDLMQNFGFQRDDNRTLQDQ